MLALAGKSRSPQIAAAAQLLAASWIASVALWRWAGQGAVHDACLAAVDLALAGAFFVMAKGRWFPVPLCFLHSGLVIYYFYVTLIGSPYAWVAALTNRAFELELAYVSACAIYRIARLARDEKGAP